MRPRRVAGVRQFWVEPRTGRNPKTGESVAVAAKRVMFFKAGKALRERVGS
ncbi:MAG: HU family DNA-binding protein [Magnetococcales bacterium]|nr:HU family DNA-binding protein [Magnetococcales bacterium]